MLRVLPPPMVVLGSVSLPGDSSLVLYAGMMGMGDACVKLGSCEDWRYFPVGRHDFGPPDLVAVCDFIRAVDAALERGRRVAYCIRVHPRSLSNAVFLMGGYMILALGARAEEVMRRLGHLQTADYVDPTGAAGGLRVRDCLDGLARARDLGWVDRPFGGWCGRLNLDRHRLWGDALNGDLHEVVPDRIMLLRPPQDRGPGEYSTDADGHRHFAARYYARVFRRPSVQVAAVVLLDARAYDPAAFEEAGVRHIEWPLAGWPTEAQAAAFARTVDAAPKVAVVGELAGALVALYLVRRRGFSGPEALGWLRIVRPGTVAARHQQQLLTRPPRPAAWRWWLLAAVAALYLSGVGRGG